MIDYISGLVRCNYKYLLKHNLLYNKYIMTVDCKPIKTNRLKNLEGSYMLYAKH